MTEAKLMESIGNDLAYLEHSLNRKTEMRDPDLGTWTYGYNQNGNLVFQSGGGGNLVTGDGYYREYDGNGRLLRVRSGSSNTSPLLESYTYDHDGQRIRIHRNDSANTTVYTPFREFMQIKNTSGTYDFTYIYDGDTQVARKNSDGSIEYDHTDHLGSVGVITNSTAGVVENTIYSPFGEELSGGNVDVKGYTGQFDDEATGQMYYGARYYKPGIGMFVQGDPELKFYDPQFFNRYAYVRNNPYRFIDPTGFAACDASKGCYSVDALDPFGLVRGVTDVVDQTTGLQTNPFKTETESGYDYESYSEFENQLGPSLIIGAGYGAVGATHGLTPSTPGIVQNAARGRANEAKVLESLGLQKNTETFKVVDPATGKFVGTIPDYAGSSGIIEVKDVKYVTQTQQLRAQAELAKQQGTKPKLITGTYTKVSKWVSNSFNVVRTKILGPKKNGK